MLTIYVKDILKNIFLQKNILFLLYIQKVQRDIHVYTNNCNNIFLNPSHLKPWNHDIFRLGYHTMKNFKPPSHIPVVNHHSQGVKTEM